MMPPSYFNWPAGQVLFTTSNLRPKIVSFLRIFSWLNLFFKKIVDPSGFFGILFTIDSQPAVEKF